MACPKMVERSLHTVKYSFHFDWPFSGRSVFLSDQCTCTFHLVTYKVHVYKRMIFRFFFLLLSEVLREDLRVFELRLNVATYTLL